MLKEEESDELEDERRTSTETKTNPGKEAGLGLGATGANEVRFVQTRDIGQDGVALRVAKLDSTDVDGVRELANAVAVVRVDEPPPTCCELSVDLCFGRLVMRAGRRQPQRR